VPRGLYRWDAGDGVALLAGMGEAAGLDIATPSRSDVNRSGTWVIADWPEEVPPGCDPDATDARAERVLRADGNGGFDVLVAMGTSIPGTPLLWAGIARWPTAGLFEPTAQLVLAESGALGFGAVLADDVCYGALRKAILAVDAAGSLALVALEGQPAPGAPAGLVFHDFTQSPALVNDGGQIVFYAWLQSATESASAVYRWDPVAGLALVAMLSPLAPVSSTPLPASPIVSAGGSVAYFDEGNLWGPDGAGGVVRRFAVGDPVPGGPEGSQFGVEVVTPIVFQKRAWIDAQDRLAFVAPMERPGSGLPEPLGAGLFRAAVDGPIELLVKTGDSAPQAGDATFGSVFAVLAFGAGGQIAFRASLERPGMPGPATESAIYLLDAQQRLVPILLAADLAVLLPLDPIERDPASASLGFDANFTHVAMTPFVIDGESALFVATIPEAAGRSARRNARSRSRAAARRARAAHRLPVAHRARASRLPFRLTLERSRRSRPIDGRWRRPGSLPSCCWSCRSLRRPPPTTSDPASRSRRSATRRGRRSRPATSFASTIARRPTPRSG
jgi:hypothetical protein